MKRNLWFGIGIILVAALLAIMLIVTQAKKKPEEIKIGAILPLTGKMAAFGEAQKWALLLAEEKVNEIGGIKGRKLKFIFEDSKADPKEAVAAINKFINIEKINIVFAFRSGEISAIQPITEKAKVLFFAFTAEPEIANRASYTFQIYPNLKQINEVMMGFIKQSDAEKIGSIYVMAPATKAFVSQFLTPGIKKMGKQVVIETSFEKDDIDIRTQALQIKQAKPEILVTVVHYMFIPMVLKTFKEMGILGKVDILGSIDYTFEIQAPTELLEGIYFVSPFYVFKTAQHNNISWFEKTYKDRHGQYPGYDPAFFFDAATLVAEGLKVHGTDVEKLKNYLLKIRNYQGVSGQISIESDKTAKVDLVLGKFEKGKRVLVEK